MTLLAIAKNTFLQTVRQPIFAIILALSLGLMALAPSLTAFTMDDDDRMLQDLGLSTLLVAGLFLAAFSASGAISAEVESRTILTIISKPIGRVSLVAGKFLGIITALFVAHYVQMLAFFMILRHGVLSTASDKSDMTVVVFGSAAVGLAIIIAAIGNYLFDWKFTYSAVGLVVPFITVATLVLLVVNPGWQVSFAYRYNPEVIKASILIFPAIVVLAAVAMACSTRLNAVWTLLICFVVLCAGMISDYFLLPRLSDADIGPVVKGICSVLYTIIPNLQYFWLIDALTAEQTIPLTYVGTVFGYAGIYVLAALLLAGSLFESREVG